MEQSLQHTANIIIAALCKASGPQIHPDSAFASTVAALSDQLGDLPPFLAVYRNGWPQVHISVHPMNVELVPFHSLLEIASTHYPLSGADAIRIFSPVGGEFFGMNTPVPPLTDDEISAGLVMTETPGLRTLTALTWDHKGSVLRREIAHTNTAMFLLHSLN